MNKKLIIFSLFAILATAGFIIAETSDLEIELNSLVSDLEGSNYSWLVDYNINYPSVEVYEENSDLKISDFGIINENKKYQVFLTNLGKGNSYDNETEILTENGWKYFYELNNEKVATLNQKTNRLEWQLPSKEHSFDYIGEMYKIVLENGSELLVSPKHKVYINEKKKDATFVASKVMRIFTDYKSFKDSKYLNLSNYSKDVEEAPVASIVMHQSNELGLHRLPGAIPGWSASTLFKKDFSLQQITDVYDSINNGNEIYFLNSGNEPVKVSLISKENYNGKIYDVDVENNIILVKKEKGSNGMAEPNRLNNFPPQNNILYSPKYLKLSDSMKGSARVAEWYTRLPDKQFSSTGNAGSNPVPGALSFSKKQNNIEVNGKLINIDGGIWSGNSETYSQNIFDLKILGGSVEFDYIVDPIILGNANSLNTNTTYENNFTHLNVSNSSIVAYYPFDDNVSATTAYDYTNNSNDGTITGAVYNTSQAIYGGAMTFDGNGDFINISSSDSINFNRTEPFSISLWLKPHQLNVQQSLIDKRNPTTSQIDYFLYIDSINRLQFLIQGEGGATDSISGRVSNLVYVFPANIWTHIVMTYDGSSTFSGVKIYINSSNKATLIATDSLTGNPNSTGNLAIGAQNASGTPVQYFKGDIDEPMIFNRELSSTEVLALYNNQTNRFFPTGEMNFTGVNFAGNDTINITLAGCQQNMGTTLRAKVNNGAYVNFDSSCFIKDYNATGNLNSANVTVGFVSDANNFYTPLVIGNLTIETNPTFPTISYDPQTPADNSTISSNSIYVNVSVADSNFENMSYYLYNESLNVSGLVGYWNFDRNTTLVNDLSGQNNDGTRVGGVNWTTGGKLGEGFSFDGTDDLINIDTAVGDLATTTTGTWSAWVKPRDATPTALMIPISFGDTAGTSDDIELRVETTGKLGAQNIVTTARWYFTTDSTTLLTDNQWTHVAIVHDNTAPVMYVNGVLTAITFAISVDKTTWSDNTPNLDNGRIGSRNINGGGNVNFFNGTIDEVMIFNKALSATDVSELYNRGLVNHTTYSAITESINWTGLVDNDYHYFADVIDDAENYNSTQIRLLKMDATFPTITINIPTNNSFSSQTNLSINFTVQDSNLNTCWYSNDTYTANTTLTNCNTNITTVQWAEGQHNATIWVNDSANNVNSSMVTFTIDTTKPTFTWENPTPADKSNTSSNSIYLNVTITDATQTSAWFDWNKTLVGYWPMDFNNATGVYDNSTYENFGTASGAVFNSSGYYGGAMTFDGVNDYINISYNSNFDFDTTDSFSISQWIKLKSGGAGEVISKTLTNTSLTGYLWYIDNTNNKVNFFLISNNGATKRIFVNSNTALTDESWTHVVTTYNGNGLASGVAIYINGVSSAVTVTNDALAGASIKSTQSLNIGDRVNRNNPFSGSIDEVMLFDRVLSTTEISALYNNTANRLQNNFTSLSDAVYNYSAYSIDKAGNLNITSPDRQITVDTTFPTWTANETNLTSSTLNGKGVYFNITLTDVNPNTYIFSWYNGTAWENTTSSYTNNQEVSISKTINIDIATINWTWYINDSANNLNQTDIWSVTLLADDNVAPNISFANPTTNATNLSQNFIFANLSFADATSLISMANISLFNSTQNIINSTQGTTSTLEINFTGLADGTYYLNASVNDTLGNRNQTETRRILLDTINPLLNITFPNNNSFSSQTNLSINYTRSDALAGLSTCWYSNDTYTANTTLANCGNITTVQWTEGQHNLTIWVNDTANNQDFFRIAFTIDATKPTISYDPETPADNSTISANSIYVNVSVADSNFENMSYYLYNETLNVSGLVGYWNFDRNTTLVNDLSGNNNDGTRVGGVNWTTGGKLGEGFYFDGVDDYVNVPDSNSLDITSAISISAWIKTSTGSAQYIITKHDDSFFLGVGINTGNKLGFYLNSVSSAWLEGTSNLNDNNWHHVMGIYNGTTILVYVDGVQENSVVRSGAILSGATSVEIGARSSGTLFTGNIDEPMIFNRALSSTEISELYNRGLVNHTTYSAITESINWTSLADNDYHYFADVIDDAENYNFTQIRLLKLDATFPTWTANETNLTASTLNGKGVYFNITLTDANSDVYIFSWYNGTAWENTSAAYTNAQEVSISKTINVDIATINWTWYINDSANNLNQTDVWSITLLADDNAAPNISFANPTTNATNLSQNFIFANLSFADATSSISMANISLFNSTQNIINSTQGTTSTLEINFTGLADGTYYLNASVNDTLGNRNQTETRKIILDATAPNLTINSPTTGTYSTSTILFNATSIDATTLVDSCWYTINSGTTNRTLSRDGATNFYNFTQTSISDSTYTARFYCNDSANNINNTQNVAFTIDTSVPIGGGPAPTTAGGGGAGAPSKPALKRIFNLEYNMYDQTISLNQVEFDKLGITNNGEVADEYTIEVKTIDNIISFEEKKIKLAPGEAKNLEFKIVSSKEPGIYTGKIIVSNGVSEREVLVTINVKTEKSLFDITLTIPESLKILLTGQNLISKIDLIQMGLKENIDVTLNYVIKDFEGQTYLSESETIAVLDQKSFEKEFFTSELSPGQYVLGTELIHPDGVAVASTHFVVQEKGIKFGKREILLSLLILVLILISLIIFLSIRKYKRVGKALKHKEIK